MTAVSRLHDLFAVFDTDGSGTLDAEEVLAILTRGEAGLSLQDAQEIVRDFDDNHDGVLSADEFAKAWASLGDGLDADALPVAGDLIEVVSGDYTGRVGEVRRYDPDWDKHRTDAEAGGDGQGPYKEMRRPQDVERPRRGPFNVSFSDVRGGAAVLSRDSLRVISRAECAARCTISRERWASERAKQDAQRETELQKQWEASGRSGRVPRAGIHRTSPIHPQWWAQPWFDAWAAAGCDHQTLGITIEGIKALLSEFEFPEAFIRSGEPGLAWVTSAFGAQHTGGPFKNSTGYDLGAFVRLYDVVSGHDDKSVLEILLTRGPSYQYQRHRVDGTDLPGGRIDGMHESHWQAPQNAYGSGTGGVDWTRHVGVAQIFYSHVQLKPVERTLLCMQNGVATHRDAIAAAIPALGEGGPLFWVDYFNLRQCQDDFKPAAVIELIAQIGFTLIELDFDPLAYLGRSFCALEAFATVKGGAQLAVIIDPVRALELPSAFAARPVDVAQAQTRRKKDKLAIDAYIEESVGFAAVNETLTAAALEGARAVAARVLESSRFVDLSATRLGAAHVPSVLELLSSARLLEAVNVCGNVFDEPAALAIVAGAAARRISVCGYYRGMEVDGEATDPNEDFDRTCLQYNGVQDHVTDVDAIFIGADMDLFGFQQGLIDNCSVGDLGAKYLAKMIESNTTLTTLFLRENRIGVEGLKAFAASLPKNSTLAVLDLTEGNPWEAAVEAGDEEAIAAAKVIEEHTFAEFA